MVGCHEVPLKAGWTPMTLWKLRPSLTNPQIKLLQHDFLVVSAVMDHWLDLVNGSIV